jgi:hypothetical protein
MSALLEAVERLWIVAADLVLVPILALRGLGRALRAARTRSAHGGAQAGPASRPSARPKKTSTA